MRKYRGLTKEGKWVYGNLIIQTYRYRAAEPLTNYYIQEQETKTIKDTDGFETSIFPKYKVIPETVGQQVGYKDLYEGDIVPNGDNYNSVIEWQCNPDQDEFVGFYLHEIYPKSEPDRFHSMFAYTTPLEVIGNRHQNPELMEQDNG